MVLEVALVLLLYVLKQVGYTTFDGVLEIIDSCKLYIQWHR